ncbi:MAG TPA: NAD-dependent epimerase/dehydratase family protein [Mycobacteriales bacterium]|nr:NAD-dependent epimerase/dehydratase family protein [Mycobacteriales bacterium]
MPAVVRRARNREGRPDRPVVAVTGAGGGMGAAVFARLAASPRLGGLVGVDTQVAAPTETAWPVSWRQFDPADPRLAQALDGVHAVAHLAVDLAPDPDRGGQRQRNTRRAQTVLTAAFAAGARQVTLVTSAMVYGALPDNPIPLADDAPLRAVPEASVLGDLLEIERIADRAARAHRGLSVTVLRPAIVLGVDGDGGMASLVEAPRLLHVRGTTPHWQFCHVDDLAGAVERALLGEVTGPANVGSDGWLDQQDVEGISGRRSLDLPERVAVATAERLHRLGITPALPSELTYLMNPWVVDTARLKAAGWAPAYTNAEALHSHLAERAARPRLARPGARGATAAAGAAVALVGTAALVRRARRKRSGRVQTLDG